MSTPPHDARPLGVVLADLDERVAIFDKWAFGAQGGPDAGTLGPSYWEGWQRYVSADPPALSATRPAGWLTFHYNILASMPDLELWDAEPPVRAMAASFERELMRYYDMAVAGGALPPAVGAPVGPAEPPPRSGTGDMGAMVVLGLAGIGIYLASRRK